MSCLSFLLFARVPLLLGHFLIEKTQLFQRLESGSSSAGHQFFILYFPLLTCPAAAWRNGGPRQPHPSPKHASWRCSFHCAHPLGYNRAELHWSIARGNPITAVVEILPLRVCKQATIARRIDEAWIDPGDVGSEQNFVNIQAACSDPTCSRNVGARHGPLTTCRIASSASEWNCISHVNRRVTGTLDYPTAGCLVRPFDY